MEVVAKPIVGMPTGERQHLKLGMERVLHKDKINKFIEKIAPKVSLLRKKVRELKDVFSYRVGHRKAKVTKFSFA